MKTLEAVILWLMIPYIPGYAVGTSIIYFMYIVILEYIINM